MVHATCCQKQASCTKGTVPAYHSVAPRDGYTWCDIDVCMAADSAGHPQQIDQGTRYRYSGFSPPYHCRHPVEHKNWLCSCTRQCIKQQAISNAYSSHVSRQDSHHNSATIASKQTQSSNCCSTAIGMMDVMKHVYIPAFASPA